MHLFRCGLTSSLCTTIIFFSLSLKNFAAYASPFTDVSDERLRFSLELLDQNPNVVLPLSSWPLSWRQLWPKLQNINKKQLTSRELSAYNYIFKQAEKSLKPINHQASISAASFPQLFSGYDSDYREDREFNTSLTLNQKWLTAHFEFTLSDNPIDEKTFRFDGSYLAIELNDWNIGYGAIDRWWGPGWQQSLILSHNARPMRGFFINRQSVEPFSWPVLSWLGPWQLQAFSTQFEEDRYVPNAELLGLRVTFKPFSFFEMGLYRVAQWAGDDRPDDFETLQNLILGRDNRGGDGIELDTSNEPGNQLAGIDMTLDFSIGPVHQTFYAQGTGEDEASGTPSRAVSQVGLSSTFHLMGVENIIVAEYSDTLARDSDRVYINYAFEHPGIYRTGYRYLERPLAASLDNDTHSLTLLGHHWFSDYQLSWRLIKASMNRDGTDRDISAGGANIYTREALEQLGGTLSVYKFINDDISVGVGGFYFQEEMNVFTQDVQSGGFISLEYQP